uniref:Uncharacterized protein n=1 Tax=uncultured bacterium contig00005 TaxID=1181497 RepID=A0A806KL81_9BACT|nr:hypothetical protein [uncultured bacterium contig00005]
MCLFFLTGCSDSSAVSENNAIFSENVKAISEDTITLNELATFEWDIMYSFIPFTPKKDIEEIIGISSRETRATYNEAQFQMIFVKDKKVVCSIMGYSNNYGYFVSFGKYDGVYLAIRYDEVATFEVENNETEILLTYTTE